MSRNANQLQLPARLCSPALLLALGVNLVVVSTSTRAQVLLSSSPNYSQNFDSLASSGTGAEAVARWTNNVTLTGWYAASQTNGSYTQYRVAGGEARSNGLYSFGTNGAASLTDRALGSMASAGPAVIVYGVRFRNDTQTTFASVTVSYTGEQWRNSTANAAGQSLVVSYRIAAALTDPQAGVTEGWTPVSSLNFTRLHRGGPAGPLDGNVGANRTRIPPVVLAGAVLKPGEELFLRWSDVDDPGQNDHGLAIDDLTVSFSTPTPANK